MQPKPWNQVVQDCLLAYPSDGQNLSLSQMACLAKAADARGWVWNGVQWVAKQ
jgi:hypothetical protein